MLSLFIQIIVSYCLIQGIFAMEKNRLEFIHIVKNAGTSIENAAAKEGIAWGACHFHQFHHCLYVNPDLEWNGGSQWHSLPQSFSENPYEDAETFAVVRNPYARVISYYYYVNRVQDMSYLNNKNRLNEFVLQVLKKRHTGLLPASEYIYDNKSGKKIIDHVLNFETLDSDGKFDKLMKKFNLDIKLPEKSVNQRKDGSHLTADELTKESIDYINDYYGKDFVLFGYQFMKGSEYTGLRTERG